MKFGDQEVDIAEKMKSRENFYDTLKIKLKGYEFVKYLNKKETEKK